MAREEEMNLVGFACDGTPVFAPQKLNWTEEEARKRFLEILDVVVDFPNGKSFYDYGDGWFFEIKDDGTADLSCKVKVDATGTITERKEFDLLAG